MKLRKTQIRSWVLTFAIINLLFTPTIVHSQAIKTILQSPKKYDGKMVHVEGKVISRHFKNSNSGNAYTTFKLTDLHNNTVSVFSFGTLPIKQGDTVKVTGIYQQVSHVPPRYAFYNEINASKGSVEKVK